MTSVWTAQDLAARPDTAWVEAALEGGHRVGSLMPPIFEARARVLHPAALGDRPIRWSTVADVNARVMHPLVEWDRIVPTNVERQSGLWDTGPGLRAPAPTRRLLARILRHHTQTPENCYFAIWEGNTALDDLRDHPTTFTFDGMRHFVVADTVTHADRDLCSIVASYWWPADRDWFVADHIDLLSTYVGGSRSCIDEILGDPDLEAFPVEPDDDISAAADTVNARFTVDLRAHRGWRVLTDDERHHWWAEFARRYRFRPGTRDDGYAGIAEPVPSLTFDLGAVSLAGRAAIDAEAMRCFTEGMVVLDWQHDGYLLDPDAHATDPHTPWPVPVYPDGDYYIFLSSDLTSGTFGHPWRQTLCVFGAPLVDTLGATLRTWLPVLRVDGHPAH